MGRLQQGAGLVLAVAGWASLGVGALAQNVIVPDGTLGAEPSVVTDFGANSFITGGAVRGGNLFHSFDTFNVGNGNGAFFVGGADTTNIFSRVTGASPSEIFGTLGTAGTAANLYFINPNGIVFGPNAALQVGGSFTASTADSFIFDDGQSYSAVNPETPPLLRVSITPGLQYGPQGAPLTVQGNLEAGRDLTLGAQQLRISGDLAAGRDIVLQGQSRLLSEGTYTVGGYVFTQDLSGAGVEMIIPHENVVLAFGDVTLEEDYIGPSLYVLAGGQVSQRNSEDSIVITGGAGGSVTQAVTTGLGGLQAVTVTSNGEPTVDIRSGFALSDLSWDVPTNFNTSELIVSFGDGVDVNAATGQSLIIDGIINPGGTINLMATADILAGNLNAGISVVIDDDLTDADINNVDGGDIILTAGNDIEADGLNSESSSRDSSFRPNGTLVANGGNGGNIILIAGNDIEADELNSESSFRDPSLRPNGTLVANGGNGGNITLIAGNDIEAGGLSSSAVFFSVGGSYFVNGGNGGDITLIASNDIEADGLDSTHEGSIYARSVNGGDGGDITLIASNDIEADRLDSSTGGFEYFGALLTNYGDAGNITLMSGSSIDADDLRSTSGTMGEFFAQFSNGLTAVGGDGGDIALIAGGNIRAHGLNSVSATTGDLNATEGNGGNIVLISTNNVEANSLISGTESFVSSGFSLSFLSSPIDTSSTVIGGNGGRIMIIAGQNIFARSLTASSAILTLYGNDNADLLEFRFSTLIGGNGGDIILLAGNDIRTTGTVRSDSSVFSGGSFSTVELITYSVPSTPSLENVQPLAFNNIEGGSGGDIFFVAGNDIWVQNIDTASFITGSSASPTVGSGGTVYLSAEQGSIGFQPSSTDDMPNHDDQLTDQAIISTGSASTQKSSPVQGGPVFLQAGTRISDIEVVTTSSSGPSGEVVIRGTDDLSLINVDVATANDIALLRTSDVLVGEGRQANDVTIVSNGDLNVIDSSFTSATNDTDPAGDVTILSPGTITFNGSSIASNTENIGDAGSINITAGEGIQLTNNSLLQAQTLAEGAAGDISITAPDVLIEQGSIISTSTAGPGIAGDITIAADTLNLTNGGEILAFTTGDGNSGTITINAAEAVNLGEGVQDFAPVISVESSSAGQPGDIIINTPSFTLSETARITATATETATSLESGGSITLNATTMDLAGIVGIFAETAGQSPGGVLTLQPYAADPNLTITLAPGAEISASTSGSGNGGDLIVSAPQILTISGPGRLAVETSGTGDGGNAALSAQHIILTDGVVLSAATTGPGQAGSITLTAPESFTLTTATVQSNTAIGSTGDGGDIAIQAGTVDISGDPTGAVPSGLFASSEGTGDSGDITLTATGRLDLTDSDITTRADQAAGGTIAVTAPQILLFGDGDITTAVASGAGAGGDITLTADLILAFDDSDILAFAADGNGGNITLATPAFFGENFTLDSLTADPATLDGNDRVDINATGAVSGAISLPDTSLVENSIADLTEATLPTDQLVAGSCIAQSESTGSFVVTGAGGVPPAPSDVPGAVFATGAIRATPTQAQTPTEPTGVFQLADGRLVLSQHCTAPTP